MGLFSGISKALFGDPSKDIQKGVDAQLKMQQEQLDYLKGVQQPVLDIRNKALPSLYGFYDPSNTQGQQQFVDSAMQSPFYNQMIQQGEEAVLRNAAATGGLRSGTTSQNLARNSQNVLQGLVNQQLQGLGSFAQTPIDTSQVSNVLGQMGQTQAQGYQAQAQANQGALGNILGLGTGLLSAAGSLGFSPFGGSSSSPSGGGNVVSQADFNSNFGGGSSGIPPVWTFGG